ncbi:hypothetical protein GCM10025880_40660 [Methylorubrum aminovorans]|nr:hypothetical protein GCM10025880_40660 [Methylorubrum aminovorans]
MPAFSGILGFFIRGFPVFAQDIAFNGLFGVADAFNPAIEPIERVEVLRGPRPCSRASHPSAISAASST